MIFLDANYSLVGSLEQASATIDSCMEWAVPYTKLYLVPMMKKDKVEFYNYSYEFIAQCIYNDVFKGDGLAPGRCKRMNARAAFFDSAAK